MTQINLKIQSLKTIFRQLSYLLCYVIFLYENTKNIMQSLDIFIIILNNIYERININIVYFILFKLRNKLRFYE